MMAADYAPMWEWVRERERVRIAKESGAPHPWTDDPVIATYRFCNVRREDDRGTVWVRENVREPYADYPYLWLMLCVARQINWPDTLDELINSDAWPVDDGFDPRRMAEVLDARKARGDKVYTGAYMISAPSVKGTSKQTYIAETVVGNLWRHRHRFGKWTTLREAHRLLTEYDGWGDFMAYQAVVDMRFTALLRDAPDVATWAAAGPGTIRGLNRLHGRRLDLNLRQDLALSEMREIYRTIRDVTGVEMDFSDVPNVLCETDKYMRGESKTRYVPGRGS